MKKVLAIILALALFASMAMVVYADDVANGDTDQDVKATVKDKDGNDLNDDDDNIERVYQVDISWESLVFVFKTEQTADELIWDTETHTYSNLVGAWQDNSRTLTLTNHSNATVGYAANYQNGAKTSEAKLGVTSKLEGADGTLATAVGTTVQEAPTVEYTISVEGTPASLSEFVVDTITVVLSK